MLRASRRSVLGHIRLPLLPIFGIKIESNGLTQKPTFIKINHSIQCHHEVSLKHANSIADSLLCCVVLLTGSDLFLNRHESLVFGSVFGKHHL